MDDLLESQVPSGTPRKSVILAAVQRNGHTVLRAVSPIVRVIPAVFDVAKQHLIAELNGGTGTMSGSGNAVEGETKKTRTTPVPLIEVFI